MKKCPFCAEEIKDEAIKCKHCGSILKNEDKEKKVNKHESYTSFTIISFLMPLIGLILGIIYLAKPNKLDKKLGEHVLVASIIFSILWVIILNFSSLLNLMQI